MYIWYISIANISDSQRKPRKIIQTIFEYTGSKDNLTKTSWSISIKHCLVVN